MFRLVLALILILAPVLARSDPAVVAMEQGQTAPFPGLLLDEKTFLKYADQQVILAQCRVDRTVAQTQVETLAREQASATAQSAPSSGYFWLGVGAGIVATVLAVLGAAQLVKASSK